MWSRQAGSPAYRGRTMGHRAPQSRCAASPIAPSPQLTMGQESDTRSILRREDIVRVAAPILAEQSREFASAHSWVSAPLGLPGGRHVREPSSTENPTLITKMRKAAK